LGNFFFETIVILLLLIANGVFAMSETALISARKARLQALVDQGNQRAQVALETATHPLNFLSTVQIGITLIGVVAGAFGGATFANAIAEALQSVPFLAPYRVAIGFGVVVLVITYLSLVIGELVPKQMALANPERIATLVAQPMRWVTKLASPAVGLLTASTRLVFKLLRVQTLGDPPVTLEEVQTLVEQGRQVGVFEAAEQEMVEGVLKLDDTRVATLMTPRTEVIWLSVHESPEQIRATLTESHRSRLPVATEGLDQVLGIVQAKDFVHVDWDARPFDLKALVKPALYFPEHLSALKALEQFKQSRIHFAFIVDEYGGIEGILTPNDILEAIVGDINGADEPQQPGVVEREDGSWLLDGALATERLKAVLQVDTLPDEAAYQTLGGFVLHQLGSIPTIGQHFEWQGVRFEVVDMDGLRIDQVLVTKTPSSTEDME
jgi:putative hemolysin